MTEPRVLRFIGGEEPPDLTYRGEPIVRTDGCIVRFEGGPLDGQYAAMPADCDEWIEPDGSVYR
jgi:hypothetical protein